MTEDINEQLQAMKILAKGRFPDDKAVINLIETDDEMRDFLKQKKEIEDGETSQQNGEKPAKRLGVVEHIHKIAEKPKEDEIEGGESLGKRGSDSIPLTPEEAGLPSSYDPTEISKSGSGKQIVANIMDEIDRLEYLSSTKGLKPEQARRYKLLRAREEELLHSLWVGYRSRGGVKKGNFWQCPVCGMDVINSNKCMTCGYLYGQKIDENEKRKWQILRG